ncbi:MAG: glycoside hydrolase family 31 protein [Mangrovibacterium sp.]
MIASFNPPHKTITKTRNSMLAFLCCLLLSGLCSAKELTYKREGNTLNFSSGRESIRISFCSEHMFRVRKSRTGFGENTDSLMVIRYRFAPVDVQVTNHKDYTLISTAKVRIKLLLSPFRISVSDPADRVLYSELNRESFLRDTVMNTCIMQPDEHFFGLGERMESLDHRGRKIYLNVELGRGRKPAVGGKDILKANYCPVPLLLSTKGYGLFFHTAYPNEWDLGWSNPQEYSYKAFGGELDYYFIYGPAFENILYHYSTLTGFSPMMPLAAYGLHLGSYSGGTWNHEECSSDAYPVSLCRRMRQEKIPFDMLWLDSTWRYFDNDRKNGGHGNGGCSFEFRETFKDPQAMIDTIYQECHVAMMGLHIRSIMDNGTRNTLLDQAVSGNHTIREAYTSGLINFFDQDAVDWWFENGVRKIADMGIKFVKTDVGSALRVNKNKNFSLSGVKGSALHNLFPIAYAKAPFLKFQNFNNMRGMDHTREGYAGIQRYPFIWAGDWGSEWQWFEPVIRAGLNIGLSGVGNWTHCMGGFEQYSPYDTDLYIRWCQFGMFSPVALLFGMDHPRYHEPWTYGKEAMDIFIKYDSIRYALLPYIYSNAYQLHKTARPMMSPLVFDWPADENVYSVSDQFLFGKGMMICPVTDKGALSRPVYFPGGKWVDYWTGERIGKRQYKSFLTPPELMPIFIRGGAIIPKQEPVQYVGEKPNKLITIETYPDGTSSFDMYEDDGISTDYEKELFALTHMESVLLENEWQLNIQKPAGNFQPPAHTYALEAYLDFRPTSVTENGKILTGWTFDEMKGKLFVILTGTNREDIRITVR